MGLRYDITRLKNNTEAVKEIVKYKRDHSWKEVMVYIKEKWDVQIERSTLMKWQTDGVFKNLDSSEKLVARADNFSFKSWDSGRSRIDIEWISGVNLIDFH